MEALPKFPFPILKCSKVDRYAKCTFQPKGIIFKGRMLLGVGADTANLLPPPSLNFAECVMKRHKSDLAFSIYNMALKSQQY